MYCARYHSARELREHELGRLVHIRGECDLSLYLGDMGVCEAVGDCIEEIKHSATI